MLFCGMMARSKCPCVLGEMLWYVNAINYCTLIYLPCKETQRKPKPYTLIKTDIAGIKLIILMG